MKLKTYLRPAALLLLTPLLLPATAHAATAPTLGTAGTFAVLAGSTVTNTGPTALIGDLGVTPGTAVTGFPPGIVSGTTHTGTDAAATGAQTDATATYNNAAGQPCDVRLTGQDLGGKTLTPGVYCFDSSAQLTGQLILDGQGNPSSVFIFQIGSTLTTASNASVVLINGAQPCSSNIFWQVGSSATLGTNTSFTGNILALASITLNTGTVTNGGLYAQTGAVTLDSNNVVRNNGVCSTAPISTSAPTSTSIAAATNTSLAAATSTSLAAATNTSLAVATSTSIAAATNTSLAAATSTSIAAATNTSLVAATSTSIVAATSTSIAAATSTSIAAATSTSLVAATSTSLAAATSTSIAAATGTSIAAATSTSTPTATATRATIPTATATLTSTTIATAAVLGVPQIRYHDVTRVHTKTNTLVRYHDVTRVHTKIKTLLRYHDVTRVHTKIKTLVHYRTVSRVTTITRMRRLTTTHTVINHKIVYTTKFHYVTVVHHITRLIIHHKTVTRTIVTYHYYHQPKTGRLAGPSTAGHEAIPAVEARLTISRLGISWAPIWARDYQANPDGSLTYDLVPAYGVTRFASSTLFGRSGLTLMSGHDDIAGSIFRYLGKMHQGDVIHVWRGAHTFRYVVASIHVVTPDDVRLLNATYTHPTLALISCTPYGVDTHRVVVIAQMQ